MFREKNIFITILVSLGIVILAVIIGFILYTPENEKEITEINDWKTYRNEEWDFEFKYPSNWSLHPTSAALRSPFSKFELIGAPPEEKVPNTIIPSLLVNIVTPDFADRAFYDLKHTASNITIAGVVGSRYEYEFEGFPQIAIDLPFGEFRMLLGANKKYENIFNQVLATFKFAK